jgi:mitogen-activated protein kinase 15
MNMSIAFQEICSDYAQSILDKAATMKRRPLSEILYSTASPEAVHMIESLLRFNPNQRLTAHAALRHPYVARFHNSSQVRFVDNKLN